MNHSTTESALRVVAQKDFQESKATYGFWLYLMTDMILFASLFATFMVLRNATAGGPSATELFDLEFVFIETVILLLSSLTCGMALLSARNHNKTQTIQWLLATGILGLSFLAMEVYEFSHLLYEGHGWQTSAFLSSYFGLVGTHGLHILIGLIWLVASLGYVAARGINSRFIQRLTFFSMFWHFLDIVWICIFTIVYLLGVI